MRIYPSLPLLNFIGFLVLAVQRGSGDLFRTLKSHYAAHLKDVEPLWKDAMDQIGEAYFGIRIPRQWNPMSDMLGSMLGAGFGGGGGGQQKKEQKKVDVPAPAPAVD